MIIEREIEQYQEFELQEFLEEVRETETLNGRVPVYANARISLRSFDPREVNPTALYVLEENLKDVGTIAVELRNQNVDIFNLTRRVDHPWGVIAPPVVELSDGVAAIVDGQHRFWWAKSLQRPITCIYVEGASLPIISKPVDWQDVVMYREKPSDPKLLRRLREGIEDTPDCLRRYYRDFSYLGSKGRRPSGNQNA